MSTNRSSGSSSLPWSIIALIGLVGYVMNKKKMEQNRARAEGLRSEAGSAATVDSGSPGSSPGGRGPRGAGPARRPEGRGRRGSSQPGPERGAGPVRGPGPRGRPARPRRRPSRVRLPPGHVHRRGRATVVRRERADRDRRRADSETDEDDPDVSPHPATHTATTSKDGQPVVTRLDSRDSPTDGGAHRA